MVDNSLRVTQKLLIHSEAFFVNYIDINYIEQCLAIENTVDKVRSVRSAKDFQDMLKAYKCFGLFNDKNELISFAFFSAVIDEAELLDINLIQNLHSKGIGSAFLKQCFMLLKQDGINDIILEVATDNIQAIKAYQKFEYQQIGIRKNYYTNNDGSKTDALVYKISI